MSTRHPVGPAPAGLPPIAGRHARWLAARSERSLPRLRGRLAAAALLAVILVVLAACGPAGASGTSGPSGSVVHLGSPLMDKPAPALTGLTLDGTAFDLTTLRGRPVIVNFWASWCGPCRDEFPLLKAALAEHAGQDLAVIGVLFKDDADPARQFVQQQGATWPTVADPARAIAPQWRVIAAPQTYLVDRNGVIRDFQIGEFRSAAEVDQALASILQ